MIAQKHIQALKQVISGFDPSCTNSYFLFGSSVRADNFRDVDLGVAGNASSRKNLADLRDRFYEAPIPYKVDVVDFDDADQDFRSYVDRNEPHIWIN